MTSSLYNHQSAVLKAVQLVASQLEPLLPFANCHIVDFLTCKLWEKYVPSTIATDLDNIKEHQLNLLLSPPTNSEGHLLMEELSQKYPHLHNFLALLHPLHLDKLGVLTSPQQVYITLGVPTSTQQPIAALGRAMHKQKIYEVQTLSQFVATLCCHLRVSWVCDLGAGKGYLSGVLAQQYGLRVVAVEGCASNVAAAGDFQRRLQRELSHQRNISNKKSSAHNCPVNNSQNELTEAKEQLIASSEKECFITDNQNVKSFENEPLRRTSDGLTNAQCTEPRKTDTSVPDKGQEDETVDHELSARVGGVTAHHCGSCACVPVFVTPDTRLEHLWQLARVAKNTAMPHRTKKKPSKKQARRKQRNADLAADAELLSICEQDKSNCDYVSPQIADNVGNSSDLSAENCSLRANNSSLAHDKIAANNRLPSSPKHNEALPSALPVSWCITGLHTCGDLAGSVLRLACGDAHRQTVNITLRACPESRVNANDSCNKDGTVIDHCKNTEMDSKDADTGVDKELITLMCSVGCCYHLLTEEFETNPENYEGFVTNLCKSDVASTATSPESRLITDIGKVRELSDARYPGFPLSGHLRGRCFVLGHNARMIAAQPMARLACGAKQNLESQYWRCLLQYLVVSKLLSPCDLVSATTTGVPLSSSLSASDLTALKSFRVGRKPAAQSSSFSDYVQAALPMLPPLLQGRVQISSEEAAAVEQDWGGLWRDRLAKFFLLRASIAPLIEGIILLDRLLYCTEQDRCSRAMLVPLFDAVTSPRCHALLTINTATQRR